MTSLILTRGALDATRPGMRMMQILALSGLSATLAGCIQVKAPDKPIEINLNVNVRQEVVVRLQQDAQKLIENNPELFPQ